MKKKKKTAAELMTELQATPSFQLQQQERERILQEKAKEWREAERPLVEALRSVGTCVDSVWELVNTTSPYPEAVPVLLEHLQYPYPDRVREGIARALAVPEARSGWNTMLRLFRQERDLSAIGFKWALGCALATAADDSVIDDVIELIMEKSHGQNRVALVDALARSSVRAAHETLVKLQSVPDLADEIRKALKKH